MAYGIMKVESCDLYFLKIPLRVSFSHGAKAERMFSDSIIVKLNSADRDGYGEAVIRDYVSGSLGSGEQYRNEAARLVARLVAPLEGRFLSWNEMSRDLAGVGCQSRDLPFLCAVETALMDLACKWAGVDVFSLLGKAPRRDTVPYGGVLPILSEKEAEKYLRFCVQLELPDIKLKLNGDPGFSSSILDLSRSILGETFDIRVDANSSWAVKDGPKLFDLCRRYGVTLVEQPFDDSALGAADALREAKADGFSIMADEGALSSGDIQHLAEAGTCSAINLRLSKNGGLTRVLGLAEEARECGLAYQLGCMVGETGILSALGRAAAALLPSPLYFEGSYDDALLTENITTKSMGFGPRGEAPVIRGQGAGYEVSPEKLARLSTVRVACL
jgi:L-Ala-D/L-Glu epimerase / N-acetyl-D-glutamate racemase